MASIAFTDGVMAPLTPIFLPFTSASVGTSPSLVMSASMPVRPSTARATKPASLAPAKSTISLNEPPDENWASLAAMSG